MATVRSNAMAKTIAPWLIDTPRHRVSAAVALDRAKLANDVFSQYGWMLSCRFGNNQGFSVIAVSIATSGKPYHPPLFPGSLLEIPVRAARRTRQACGESGYNFVLFGNEHFTVRRKDDGISSGSTPGTTRGLGWTNDGRYLPKSAKLRRAGIYKQERPLCNHLEH